MHCMHEKPPSVVNRVSILAYLRPYQNQLMKCHSCDCIACQLEKNSPLSLLRSMGKTMHKMTTNCNRSTVNYGTLHATLMELLQHKITMVLKSIHSRKLQQLPEEYH